VGAAGGGRSREVSLSENHPRRRPLGSGTPTSQGHPTYRAPPPSEPAICRESAGDFPCCARGNLMQIVHPGRAPSQGFDQGLRGCERASLPDASPLLPRGVLDLSQCRPHQNLGLLCRSAPALGRAAATAGLELAVARRGEVTRRKMLFQSRTDAYSKPEGLPRPRRSVVHILVIGFLVPVF
jgi:hypothetical protein